MLKLIVSLLVSTTFEGCNGYHDKVRRLEANPPTSGAWGRTMYRLGYWSYERSR